MTSSPRQRINEEAFWNIVTVCLVDFHKYSYADAQKAVEEFKSRLESQSDAVHLSVLHDEPFNVACDLAGDPLDIEDYSPHYDAILEKIG